MSSLEVILLVIGLAIGVALLMVLAFQMGKHKNLIPVVLSVVGVGIIIFSVYCITDLNYYYNVKGGVYGVITDLFHVNIVEGEEELEFSLSNIALKQINGDEYGAKITINRTIAIEDNDAYIVCVNGIPCTTSEVDKIHAQATYAYTFYDKQMKGFEDTLAFSFAFYPNYTTLSVTTKGGSEAVKNWNSYFQKNNFAVTFEESMFKFEDYEQEEEIVDYCITYYVDNEVYEQQLVKSNQTFILINAPEKKGYTFDGWADAEGNIVDITRTTQNIDLYAVYSESQAVYLDYTFSGNKVTGYTGTSTDLVIPSSYSIDEYGNFIEGDDYKVTAIHEDFVLRWMDINVKTVIIPNGVSHQNSFTIGSGITSIEYQSASTGIGFTDYYGCNSLRSIILNFNHVAPLFNADWSDTGINTTSALVYVPDELVEEYKADSDWKVIKDRIKPISELA